MTLEQAVWVDPDRMSGAPCFRGSRLPVQQLFDWLADGVTLDEFVEDFRIDRRAAETVLRAAGVDFCHSRAVLSAGQTPRGMKVLLDVGISPRSRIGLQDALDGAQVDPTSATPPARRRRRSSRRGT